VLSERTVNKANFVFSTFNGCRVSWMGSPRWDSVTVVLQPSSEEIFRIVLGSIYPRFLCPFSTML
jgi:hypothetical protein